MGTFGRERNEQMGSDRDSKKGCLGGWQVYGEPSFLFFFGHARRHVGSSPTRDGTHAPCSGSTES